MLLPFLFPARVEEAGDGRLQDMRWHRNVLRFTGALGLLIVLLAGELSYEHALRSIAPAITAWTAGSAGQSRER